MAHIVPIGPANLAADTDAAYVFSSPVKQVIIQNNSTVPVNIEQDVPATPGSLVAVALGGVMILDEECSEIHLLSSGTPAVNGSVAGNVVIRGGVYGGLRSLEG